MDTQQVDTQRAYGILRTRITTLDLAPGAALNEQHLAADLELPLAAVWEALKLLAHDHLVVITPRHGPYVADVNLPDLEQLSELRVSLESLSARLAAQRATADDLAALAALRQEQIATDPADAQALFAVDHKFHQAIARAANNSYLAQALDHFFGLSQRLWYRVLPHLAFLPSAVEKHIDLVEAIRAGDADRAEGIMRHHVADFYDRVRQVLAVQGR